MPKGMSKLNHLNFLSYYIVGEKEDNGIRELGTLDDLRGSFCISKMENVKNSGEASEARMGNKKHINTLKLEWLPDNPEGDIDDVQTERDILDKLQPHQNLKELSISGYQGETFPDWLGLSRYFKMTKLTLNGCMNCGELPSLGQLPSLQHLEISKLVSLEKIGLEFFYKKSGSFQQETAFKCLETLMIEDMSCWMEWHFPGEFDGFPELRVLEIRNCPLLRGDLPSHLPALEKLTIVGCVNIACSLPRAPKLHQLYVHDYGSHVASPHNVVISRTQMAMSALECLPHIHSPRVQRMLVQHFESEISISADHLPASLEYLEIYWCPELTISEQLQHKLLTEIRVVRCRSLTIPLGDLPNLKKLELFGCKNMEYVEVPHALPSLRYLSISHCNNFVSLQALGTAMPSLEDLSIYNCPKIDCFAEEWLPPSLKFLRLTECHKLASWIASNGLQSEGLTHLELRFCDDVKSFPREGCLLPASLEYLQLCGFSNLDTLHCKGFYHLSFLKKLEISFCEKLENITEKHVLASIQNICIRRCPLRTKLKEMEHPRIQFFTDVD
ncbi:hypothetical protein PIB30_036429 [Stylosanthes scabra]|uniref:R13L1/DRL21-like LRR repeat region domain-containing protein n=1 Tax=Stylosanthes scabra TaxID=79078 RepID=A0ABU6TDM5_9FABA|nr:hypothetical protein [Stylosanthes scabra]